MSEPAKTPPPDQSKAPGKRSRMLFWLGCTGCLFGLILLGVGGTMAYLFVQESRSRQGNRLPAGWRDSLRAVYTLPAAVVVLAPREGPPGPDLATAAMVPADSMRRGRLNLSRRLTRGVELQAGDEDVLAATLSDTALDRVAAMARFGDYDVMPRLADSAVVSYARNPLAGFPRIGERIARAGAGLVVRGEARLRRGDIARARDDFRAALKLGVLMWRAEPTMMDMLAGRSLLHAGSEGLARIAARVRDTALARETSEIGAWARRGSRLWFFVGDDTDSLLLVAADTLLPRGLRIESIQNTTAASLYKFSRVVFGPSSAAVRGVRALEADPDSVVARAAVLAGSTLARIDDMGIRTRWRLITRGSRR